MPVFEYIRRKHETIESTIRLVEYSASDPMSVLTNTNTILITTNIININTITNHIINNTFANICKGIQSNTIVRYC